MSEAPNEPAPSDSSLTSHQRLAELMGTDIYAALFEHADQGKALLNPDGQPLAANQALCNLLGYRQENLLKLMLSEWASEAERPLILKGLEQVTSRLLISWQTEKHLLHRHGQLIPVRLQIFRLTGIPNESAILLLEVQDLSREAQAEVAWQTEQERLRQAERLAGAAHAIWNPTNGEGYWSQGAYTLFGQGETFVPSFETTARLFEPAEAARIQAAIKATCLSETPQICNARLIRPDGQERTLSLYFEILKESSEQGDLLLSYVMDISPLKEQLERLQAANQAISLRNQQLKELSEILDDQLSEPLSALQALSAHQAANPLNEAAQQGLESLNHFSRELHENRHLDWERLPLSIEVSCLRVIQMLEAELAKHRVQIALDFSAWTFIEYVPFYLENLLYHLLRESLLRLPPDYEHPLSLYTQTDLNNKQALCLEAPALDLRPIFESTETSLLPLLNLLKDWGGIAHCRFEPLIGSRCELQF